MPLISPVANVEQQVDATQQQRQPRCGLRPGSSTNGDGDGGGGCLRSENSARRQPGLLRAWRLVCQGTDEEGIDRPLRAYCPASYSAI